MSELFTKPTISASELARINTELYDLVRVRWLRVELRNLCITNDGLCALKEWKLCSPLVEAHEQQRR